ncbi:MAG TPA: thiosulfate oxidation carrier complex protein SoxZ [Burkholderiaceae bacterium]|nr:thiosulfate oxidation carrier complex protein SoxZ [Burkholderiaceae bacterium]
MEPLHRLNTSRHLRDSGRRAVAAVLGGLILGKGLAVPPLARAARPVRNPFDAMRLDDAIEGAELRETVPTGSITIEAPDFADDASAVPIRFASHLAQTSALHLLIDANPFPYVARFEFTGDARPQVALRVRVAGNSLLRIIAEAQGGRHLATRPIQVAAGGCAASDASAPAYPDPPPPIRLLARSAARGGELRLLLYHPMENGLRVDRGGNKIPDRFIESLEIRVKSHRVIHARLGRSVSTNPLLSFQLTAARAGDDVAVNWRDSHGASRYDTVRITD